MNFLNSAFLAGLAAAVVPLLIHLLNRRKVRTVDFSSVMFLRDLRKTRMRRLQLRRWLLMAIRTLMIAFAVLAFARPAIKSSGLAALGSRARTSAVIALDRSASMALETQNGTAYERAQRRMGEITALFGEGDQAMGLPFSGESAPKVDPPTADFAGMTQRLKALPVGYGATDGGAALGAAVGALQTSRNQNREVYLITDRRRGGFIQTVPPPAPADRAAVTVFVVDASEPGGIDLGVTGVQLANQLLEPGSPFAITATVANNTDRPVDRVLVSLFIDGRRVAQREASLTAGGTATAPFEASVEAPGVHSGFVEISADDNPMDDRRHFAVNIPDRIRVLLASDYPSGRAAAALALAPLPEESKRVVIDQIDSGNLPRRNLFDYDAVVITEWRKPDRLAVDQLLRFARAGGGVFTAPSIDADTTAWNTLVVGPLYSLRIGDDPAPPSPDRFFVWDHIDWNHPIWSVYRDVPHDKIPEIRWFSVFHTQGTATGASVVDFSGGRPSLSEARLESGKWLCLWSPLNAPYTDLPLRSIFVPFTNRLVEYLAADLSERRGDYAVDAHIVHELARNLPANTSVEILRPDGAVVRPGIEQTGTRLRLTYDGADQPGVYTIVTGDKPIDAFAVNIDPREMDPAEISPDELQRRWAGYHLVWIDPGQPVASVVTQTRYGTEIRPAFLWAVVVLFFLEMWVARTRRRDLPETQRPSESLEPARVGLHPAE